MQKLLESLSPLERKLLPFIKTGVSFSSLLKDSGLKDIEITRALSWLEGKKVITIKKDVDEKVVLGGNGENYLRKGLPEKRFLNAIKDNALTLNDIKLKADLDDNEAGVSLGILKRKNAIEMGKKIKITHNGLELLKKGFPEEAFLKRLPIAVKGLSRGEHDILKELKQRKEIIRQELSKEMIINLTALGGELKKQRLEHELLETVTTGMLKTGVWKDKKFRRYNIDSVVPKVYPGRRHFSNQALKYVRRVWLDMGFKEMNGSLVQTAFWDLDALFVPQDHPARTIQDTFYIKNPSHGKLKDKEVMRRVKAAHENGGNTGSKGWQYSWSEEVASQLLMMTHDTCLSARVLSRLKEKDLPWKSFQIKKVFRNEVMDWKHLFEFYQVGGIVVDENFRHLLGYLKQFFGKMGFEKVRFRPAYFPYTEPSIEVDVYHPVHKKWIELGGAGIFRPEVVKPLLGKDVPVLAWGLGVERILCDYYGIKDLREIYKNDLKQLREIKLWIR